MTERHLTCLLYAPLAAMGSIAVGRIRPSWSRPGRSAVLGLIAGALGIDRDDDERHLALERDVRIGMLIEHSGRSMIDYHTVQSAAGDWSGIGITRADILRSPESNTLPGTREYRTDVIVFLSLSLRRPEGTWTLEQIAAALRAPRYTPYFGRKACPLGLPPAPEIAEYPDIVSALRDRQENGLERRHGLLPMEAKGGVISLDFDPQGIAGANTIRTEIRRDSVISRQRWQFRNRTEWLFDLPGSMTEDADVSV